LPSVHQARPDPGEPIMVDYIGVSDIQRLVRKIGTGEFIERLAREIEADYRRWSEFEKSARVSGAHAAGWSNSERGAPPGSHSGVGVIELMPTSDGRLYSFKYVNGHPKNTSAGPLTGTGFGGCAAGGRGDTR